MGVSLPAVCLIFSLFAVHAVNIVLFHFCTVRRRHTIAVLGHRCSRQGELYADQARSGLQRLALSTQAAAVKSTSVRSSTRSRQVLDHADDEADRHHLHRPASAWTPSRLVAIRDQQQQATRHAGRTAGGEQTPRSAAAQSRSLTGLPTCSMYSKLLICSVLQLLTATFKSRRDKKSQHS